MPPRGGLSGSLGEGPRGHQDGPAPGDFTPRRGHPYAPARRIRLVAYGARLESGLGVKALRGSNPLSSATGQRRHSCGSRRRCPDFATGRRNGPASDPSGSWPSPCRGGPGPPRWTAPVRGRSQPLRRGCNRGSTCRRRGPRRLGPHHFARRSRCRLPPPPHTSPTQVSGYRDRDDADRALRRAEVLRQQRERLQTRHAHALTSLLDSRRDLRGVHQLADLVDDAVRWSA